MPSSCSAAPRSIRVPSRANPFLARHPGRVVSRDELLRKVWGYDYLGETRTVDVHVRRLRMKLGAETAYIETVTGAGYKFATPAARP